MYISAHARRAPPEEAQQRGALHSHILVWYAKRDIEKDYPTYNPLQALPRTAPGNDYRQRPRTQVMDDVKPDNYQEDNIYFHNKAGQLLLQHSSA